VRVNTCVAGWKLFLMSHGIWLHNLVLTVDLSAICSVLSIICNIAASGIETAWAQTRDHPWNYCISQKAWTIWWKMIVPLSLIFGLEVWDYLDATCPSQFIDNVHTPLMFLVFPWECRCVPPKGVHLIVKSVAFVTLANVLPSPVPFFFFFLFDTALN
jgi:hypothetical protein